MDGDELGMQVLELLLQGFRRGARDEELAFVAADLAADLVFLAGEIVVLIRQELRRQCRVRACRGPSIGRLRRAGRSRPRRSCRLPFVGRHTVGLCPGGLPLVDLFLRCRLGTGRGPIVRGGASRSGLRRLPGKLAAAAGIAHRIDSIRNPQQQACRRREISVQGRAAPRPSARSVISMSASTIPWTGGRRPRLPRNAAIGRTRCPRRLFTLIEVRRTDDVRRAGGEPMHGPGRCCAVYL